MSARAASCARAATMNEAGVVACLSKGSSHVRRSRRLRRDEQIPAVRGAAQTPVAPHQRGTAIGAGGQQYLYVASQAAVAERARRGGADFRDRTDRPHLARPTV